MRKFAVVFTLAIGCSLFAQQNTSRETASQHVAQEDERAATERWKLINTGIFVLLLGFAVVKLAPKFFEARSSDIQKAIKDATGLKIEADFRYSQIDKKMANLPSEVSRMKAEADAEIEREHQRMRDETTEEIEHIRRTSDYEIESLRLEGAQQVKQHTAQLALGLAEHRLIAHFANSDEQNNVPEFVALVGGKNRK